MENDKMRCPICKSELIVTGQERLETLLEHVSNPNGTPCLKNKFECSNESCSSKNVVFWNEGGELYIHKNENAYEKYNVLEFIDKNNGSFGTISRKINIEIGKNDENFYFNKNGKYRIFVKYKYMSNENGDILNRKRKYELHIYNKKNNEYIQYVSGISLFIFIMKEFHYSIKSYNKGNTNAIYNIKDTLNGSGNWWKSFPAFYAKWYLKFKNINI